MLSATLIFFSGVVPNTFRFTPQRHQQQTHKLGSDSRAHKQTLATHNTTQMEPFGCAEFLVSS